MATTQFAMVEELASLVKDNLFSKHLVLSTEESLVRFLQDGTSLEGVIELQPMSSYDRLLLHRLADIFGFAHESVGEGDDRHLVLERSPETAIPAILVSDILWQYDDYPSSPAPSQNILRRKDSPVMEATETRQSSTPFELREAAYLAARERIFSPNLADDKEVIAPRSRKVPVVAQRMITHALGKKVPSDHSTSQNCEASQTTITNNVDRNNNQIRSLPQADERSVVPKSDSSERRAYDKPGGRTNDERQTHNREARSNEERGAARRMFANALGMTSAKGTPSVPIKSNGKMSK